MKILIISWFFPPWNESASGRPGSWARLFAEMGHEVTVLTCQKEEGFHGNLTLPRLSHRNLKVVETPLRFTRTPIGKGASWAFGSLPTVRRLAQGKDVIISTFMPWFVHLMGMAAKAANRDAFWCADFRDLWHDFDYMTASSPLKRRISRLSEAWIVKSADLITTVSPPLAEKLSETHPHIRCETVYNGFHRSDLREPALKSRLIERSNAGKDFLMLYTGTIYPRGYHNPEPLYAALAKRKAKGMRPVRVLFYGHCSKLPFLRDLARTYGVEDAIVIPDEFLSRSDCIALQGEVDLLLHLSWTNPGMDGVLSAKVFEYMASGVPLLSIGAESDTAIGRLLEESGTGVCVGTDEQKVFEVLEIMADQNEYPAWFKPNPVQIDTYSRECQAARLLTLIKDANANLTYESLAMEGEVQSN